MLQKLPRRLAWIGVGVCALYIAYFTFDWYFNFWHLPTVYQHTDYRPPMIYYWVQTSVYFFCPSLYVLQFFMWGWTFTIIGWIVTGCINAILYFWVGKGVQFVASAALRKHQSRDAQAT
jgi:hypothetical protein